MLFEKLFLLVTLPLVLSSCGKDDSVESDKESHPQGEEVYELPAAFSIGPDAFDPDGGHIQGIAASDDALYLAQATYLSKVNWNGKLVRSKIFERHLGDLCWYDGELFGVIANNGGKICVFDSQLSLKREVLLDRGVDGVTCLDGVLYVGMGSKTAPSSEPHRVNILGRFDAKTLEEIAPRAEFDYGYMTRYGFQDMSTDGKYIYAAFYVADSSSPQVVVFDKDLKIVKLMHVDETLSNGFDLMPRKYRGDELVFVKSKSVVSSRVTCNISYWRPLAL